MIGKLSVDMSAFNSYAIYLMALSQSIIKFSHELQHRKLQWLQMHLHGLQTE